MALTTQAENMFASGLAADLRSGRKNAVINGNFDIWQRGVSFVNEAEYSADRWDTDTVNGSGAGTVTQEAFTLGQTNVPNEPRFFLRLDRTTAGSGNSFIQHRVEDVRTFAGKTVTISLFMKAAASTNMTISLRQEFGTGGSPSAAVSIPLATMVLTTSFQKFTFTTTLPSISGKTLGTNNNDNLKIFIISDAATALTVDIAQVQLEEGTEATDFEQRSVGEELALCQRYFEKTYDFSVAPGAVNGDGNIRYIAASTTQSQTSALFKFEKRTTPTILMFSPTTGASGVIRDAGGGADVAAGGADVGTSGFVIIKTTNHTTAQSYIAHFTADAEL